jgi:microcystin-dependent protein
MAEPFMGEIRMISFDYAPDGGWAFCNGQSLNISEYNALYSLIGTKYGGDGKTTFNLPNLNGKNLRDPIIPLGSNNTTLGQTGVISIPPPITSSIIPAQSISFTLVNKTVI